MQHLDPKPTNAPLDTTPGAERPAQALTTSAGVRVVVHEPPPAPRRARERREPQPSVVVRPPRTPETEADEAFRAMWKAHGAFIVKLLLSRHDLLVESAKDLRQDVLVTLRDQLGKGEPIQNPRGFITNVVKNAISNHKRVWRPAVNTGADVNDATSAAPSPEHAVELAELRAKLMRYITLLPEVEADVVRCIDLLGLSPQETADALDRPYSTVQSQHARAVEHLKERARASERETELGKRRRPGRW